MKKVSMLFVFFVFSFVVFSAKSAEPFRIGIAQEFETLNPMNTKAQITLYMYGLVGRALVMQDANGEWIPQLAERIPTIKNGDAKITLQQGKKVLTARWKIRPRARWSDGQPVICADFLLARQIAESPNVSVGAKEEYTMIEKIEWAEKDPKTCTFTYDKPRWNFNRLDRMMPVPAHHEKSVFEKFGSTKEGYDRNSLYVQEPTKKGLYNGPYQVSELKLSSHVTFVPNPYFWGPAPKIQQIIVKLIPDTGTMIANLRSKTIDGISSLGMTFDQGLEFEKVIQAEKLPYTVDFKSSIAYEHVDFDMENPFLKDVKVRQAMAYAINRDELVKSFYESKQAVADHFLPPDDPWIAKAAKNYTVYRYDRKKAETLLDQAGWKMNSADGFRYKNGEKLSLQFMTTAGNKNRETVQVFLQSAWKKIGIEIRIKNEPPRVLFSETVTKRKYGGLVLLANSGTDPKPIFHSSQIPTAQNSWSGFNTFGWKNAKVDEALEKFELEFDVKAQAAQIQKVIRLYTEELPMIPLFYRANTAINSTRLKGFKLFLMPIETAGAENWEF